MRRLRHETPVDELAHGEVRHHAIAVGRMVVGAIERVGAAGVDGSLHRVGKIERDEPGGSRQGNVTLRRRMGAHVTKTPGNCRFFRQLSDRSANPAAAVASAPSRASSWSMIEK